MPVLHRESAVLADLDPRFAGLVARYGPVRLRRRTPVDGRFASLAESIAYQQLNGSAAATIWGRVQDALGGEVTPHAVLRSPEPSLRAAGLSGAKARALVDLAAHVEDGRLDLASLGRRSDDEVVDALSQVWGIGRWTAHMFLIFDLHRLDVWPVDDYGVRTGWSRLSGGADLTAREMVGLADPLRPYRSLAAWYCWRVVDG